MALRGSHLRAGAQLRRAAPILVPIALFLVAAAISGFTLLRRLDPYDEGQILLATHRVALGQLPYADFVFPYGPGHPFLLGGLERVFGQSLLWWRLARVAADASVALLVYVLVRREATPPVALLAWLVAATGMAQPGGPNPFPIALAFGLGAFAVATAAPAQGRAVAARTVGAGALVALAAAWRLDFGVFAGAAVLFATLLAPAPARIARAGGFVLAALGIGAILYAPFMVAAGPVTVYRRMIGDGLQFSGYWTLPFPLHYHGGIGIWPLGTALSDAKDLIGFYVPLALVVGVVIAAVAVLVRARVETLPWRWVGLLVFCLGGAAYLRSRTDEFHTQPLLVLVAVLLGWVAGRGLGPRGGVRALQRLAVAGALAVLVFLAAAGTSNRLSALLLPPRLERVSLPIADGVTAPAREAEALQRLVPYVRARVPARTPIFVAPRRSDLVRYENLLLYVLVDRPTLFDAGATLQALPAQQRRTVAAMQRTRPPVVVRWTNRLSSGREPNQRGRPTRSRSLDDYLATHYRFARAFGDYRVLIRR